MSPRRGILCSVAAAADTKRERGPPKKKKFLPAPEEGRGERAGLAAKAAKAGGRRKMSGVDARGRHWLPQLFYRVCGLVQDFASMCAARKAYQVVFLFSRSLPPSSPFSGAIYQARVSNFCCSAMCQFARSCGAAKKEKNQ